jgi:hypothetical protein
MLGSSFTPGITTTPYVYLYIIVLCSGPIVARRCAPDFRRLFQDFGLYDNDEDIETLDEHEFNELVRHSGQQWFVNFYSSGNMRAGSGGFGRFTSGVDL